MAAKKKLSYYLEEIKRQNPGISDKDANTIAQKIYSMDPESDFSGKRPEQDPTYKIFKANEKAKSTATPTPTATATSTPTPSTTTASTTNVIPPITSTNFQRVASGIQSDFLQFVNGTLNYNSGGQGSASLEPYVSGKSTPEQPNPKPIVILPTADGRNFIVGDLDKYVEDYIASIPRGDLSYFKTQLKDYFPSDTAFRRSLQSGPVTDRDVDFANAVKKALQQITVNNFNTGKQVGLALQKDRNFAANSAGFYSFDSWVRSRITTPEPTSASERTSGLTTKEDALAEFRRTVQQYVGDFDLVDNYDALAEAYWEKLHQEELTRQSQSYSVVDPITGNRTTATTSFAQLSEQDRLDMRIKFITKGAVGKKGKVISIGIRDAKPEELQDAGGLIGDNYTKIKGYAYDYGVSLTDEQIKAKAAEALLPGGSIDEQKRTIQLASRALYKSLAPYIEGGLKVSDIADQFRKLKADELELSAGAIDIFDSDVQAALTADKLMSPNDYLMQVRANPEWRFTRKANESAASFLDAILKTWGYVG